MRVVGSRGRVFKVENGVSRFGWCGEGMGRFKSGFKDGGLEVVVEFGGRGDVSGCLRDK